MPARNRLTAGFLKTAPVGKLAGAGWWRKMTTPPAKWPTAVERCFT